MNTAPKKISYRWTDRAIRLMHSIDGFGDAAPQHIQQAAFDSVQHFVWATDCRRQSLTPRHRQGDNFAPGWGAKADKAHRAGKKAFAIAQAWLDEARKQ